MQDNKNDKDANKCKKQSLTSSCHIKQDVQHSSTIYNVTMTNYEIQAGASMPSSAQAEDSFVR